MIFHPKKANLKNNMAVNLYKNADSNVRKTWLWMFIFAIFIIGLGWIFSYNFGNSYILYGAVAFSVIWTITSYWNSDKMVLRNLKAKEVDFQANKELYRLVENLAITAGLPMPRVYVINSPALNAFATGRSPQKAVVGVTSGLLEKLNKTELEGVLAHELSHIGNRDTLLATVLVIMVGFIVILSDWFLRFSFFGGRRDSREGGQLGAILAIAGLVLAILSPIIASLIQLAISRKREFLADAQGALLTRYPEGLASALEKIAQDPNQIKTINKATAQLFIANPFKKKNLAGLLATHPPVEKRIAALRGLEK